MCLIGSGRVFFLSRSDDSSESLSPAFWLPHYTMRLQDVSSSDLYYSFSLQPCLLYNAKPQAWRHQLAGSLYCLEGSTKAAAISGHLPQLSNVLESPWWLFGVIHRETDQQRSRELTVTTSMFSKVWPCWRKCGDKLLGLFCFRFTQGPSPSSVAF